MCDGELTRVKKYTLGEKNSREIGQEELKRNPENAADAGGATAKRRAREQLFFCRATTVTDIARRMLF